MYIKNEKKTCRYGRAAASYPVFGDEFPGLDQRISRIVSAFFSRVDKKDKYTYRRLICRPSPASPAQLTFELEKRAADKLVSRSSFTLSFSPDGFAADLHPIISRI